MNLTAFSTFGTISPPESALTQYQGQAGLVWLLNQIITIIYTLSGIFFLFNFIMGGFFT